MELDGCEAIRDATRGCRLVLLAATDAEAEPLLRGFRERQTHLMATKKVIVGTLEAGGARAEMGDSGSVVRAVLAITGCDKANAAHSLACLLVAMDPRPSLVLQSGVAGAFPGRGEESSPGVGDLVFATEEIYSDTGSSSPDGWQSAGELGLPIAQVQGIESGGRFLLDAGLVRTAMEAVGKTEEGERPGGPPAVYAGPCVTTSRITGVQTEGEAIARRWGALAESMEGAAAAQVCALHGVPFLEVRGISNLVVDRDRASWEIARSGEVAAWAALAVAAALETLPLAGRAPRPNPPYISRV